MTDEHREWFSIAVALDAENRQLRAWLTALILWATEREELLEFARDTIARRWPESRESP